MDTVTSMAKVAVVTGASRGAGKGIAIALGQSGATVYVTGRSQLAADSPYGGTIGETAALIDAADSIRRQAPTRWPPTWRRNCGLTT
jgi:NAD(P)-dependent dehydrogenase (short-subunit alcohol dehydrogenase family)